MDTIEDALAAQQTELSQLVDGMTASEWQRPSPCEGWTVADVVLHLAQTNELAIASARGRFAEVMGELTAGARAATTIDDGAALMVERERGAPPPALRARWEKSVQDLRNALAACDPHTRVVWVAGELSARTLATTRLAETWIHTGDVAAALGRTLAPAERLGHVARLAWRTLPYAFTRAGRVLHGPVAFELESPSGAPWHFAPDTAAATVIRGDGVELCLVAARRLDPAGTGLRGEGADADAVLELVRTYA